MRATPAPGIHDPPAWRDLHGRHVLVTGGTGFVGRHLVAGLLSAGALPKVLARSAERGHALDDGAGRVEIVPGDLTDATALASACREAEIVIHGAAVMPSQPGGRLTLKDYQRVNVEATVALAEAAGRAGAARFVFVSSTAAMGTPSESRVDETTLCRPQSPYEVTKRAAEERLLAMHSTGTFPVVIVRPCLIAGAGQRGGVLLKLFRLCRRGLVPVFGGRLDLQKPLVDVDDVVQALMLAATRGPSGEIYLVTSGERHTLREMLETAGRLVGNPRPYRTIPLPLARAAAHLTTPLARLIGRDPPLSPERLALLLTDRAIDIDKAKRQLGYAPQHRDLHGMLARTHAWYVRSGQL